MKRMVKQKQKVSVVREFEIYDENGLLLIKFNKAEDVSKFLEKDTATVYNYTNSAKFLKTKHGKVLIKYTKKKTTTTEKEDIPFEIPQSRRMKIENLEGEIWKSIPGFPECNMLSNKGRYKLVDVFGNETLGTIIKSTNKNGRKYSDINLERLGDKRAFKCRLSRALAKTFIDESFGLLISEDKRVVDHIDNNTENNCIENLRICTSKENLVFAFYDQGAIPGKKMRAVVVEDADGNKINFRSVNECARSFGVNPGTVFTCIKTNSKLKKIYRVSYGVPNDDVQQRQ